MSFLALLQAVVPGHVLCCFVMLLLHVHAVMLDTPACKLNNYKLCTLQAAARAVVGCGLSDYICVQQRNITPCMMRALLGMLAGVVISSAEQNNPSQAGVLELCVLPGY